LTRSEKVRTAVRNINAQLRQLRTALKDAVAAGMQSATISSGGASQSYTRMPLADVRQTIADLERAKAELLAGSRRGIAPNFTFAR